MKIECKIEPPHSKKKKKTCPATAKPSARRDEVNQTCKQIWKAAIGIEPSVAALEAARVTHIVTAITLVNSQKPVPKITKHIVIILD